MYDFKDPQSVENDLMPEELCIAKIPNTDPTGYTHHVALTYKSIDGDVMSLTMAQHHGEVKEGTLEALSRTPVKKKKVSRETK